MEDARASKLSINASRNTNDMHRELGLEPPQARENFGNISATPHVNNYPHEVGVGGGIEGGSAPVQSPGNNISGFSSSFEEQQTGEAAMNASNLLQIYHGPYYTRMPAIGYGEGDDSDFDPSLNSSTWRSFDEIDTNMFTNTVGTPEMNTERSDTDTTAVQGGIGEGTGSDQPPPSHVNSGYSLFSSPGVPNFPSSPSDSTQPRPGMAESQRGVGDGERTAEFDNQLCIIESSIFPSSPPRDPAESGEIVFRLRDLESYYNIPNPRLMSEPSDIDHRIGYIERHLLSSVHTTQPTSHHTESRPAQNPSAPIHLVMPAAYREMEGSSELSLGFGFTSCGGNQLVIRSSSPPPKRTVIPFSSDA